jgi:hypothetical protein
MWNITYIFTGPNGNPAGPVNVCVECLRLEIGDSHVRKLRRLWADAPFVRVELPI